MPKPYAKEFRDDVVNVARNRQPGQHLKQITADFGISESCLTNWMKAADVEDGVTQVVAEQVAGCGVKGQHAVGDQAGHGQRGEPFEPLASGTRVPVVPGSW